MKPAACPDEPHGPQRSTATHGRPPESWASIGARLAAVLATPVPDWVSPTTLKDLRLGLLGLRSDLLTAVRLVGVTKGAGLGFGVATWNRWRKGWLAPRNGER